MDHGIDWLGDDAQPEELNKIVEDKHYGWPYHYGANIPNPHSDPTAGIEKSEWAKVSVPIVLGYTAHSAPMQMSFYTGTQFPAIYQGDAFVSMRGSWNRKPPSGYEIVRINFKDGKPTAIEPFVRGFLTTEGQHGRPCGNAIAKDGSLLFTDDRNGVIYRVSYTGSEKGGDAMTPPVAPAPKPVKLPIAMEAPETKCDGKLSVTSPAYKNGDLIPARYSGYEQNASVPLTWTAGPEGTKSYVILMDDPDAKVMQLPVPHWVAWNIPSDTTALREGVAKLHRLIDPKLMDQGANYSGKVGYDGPRPAAGDPPHNYHIQVLAVDTKLELPLGAKRADVLAAIRGHVLAKGDLVGRFARPPEPTKP